MSDIFNKLNELNNSLQGRNTNVLLLSDRINAFQKKLKNSNAVGKPWSMPWDERSMPWDKRCLFHGVVALGGKGINQPQTYPLVRGAVRGPSDF